MALLAGEVGHVNKGVGWLLVPPPIPLSHDAADCKAGKRMEEPSPLLLLLPES